ncbi:helix-turn-helix transcriptional regulator [Micromonospora sp. NPDC050187]|uniref:helix-turn-helix transcriptional regulator n=1 Tax=Micromonospora sp. NPDC050187 TaxID=3364277 RepID=UPI00378AE8AD
MGARKKRLYGAQELRERLGVSRTRVLQLVARPDFPEPYERLAGGAIWLAEDVERWIAEHQPWKLDDHADEEG